MTEYENLDESLEEASREDFQVFAERAFEVLEPASKMEPNWHIECIAEHLMAVERGEIQRIIINLPPRALKSYLTARAFPAWKMGRDPQTKFIGASYSHDVMEANVVGCRKIMGSKWYQKCFPDAVIGDMDRMSHFETTLAGQYYGTSALSAVTGLGCDYMLIDDPIKPMEASSETIRNSTNENIKATLFSRFNDQRTGKLIMIMQRTHDDDPTGHLMKDGGYHLLKLPAETKTYVQIKLDTKKWEMEPDSLLFPARLPREALDRLRRDMTEYNYVGQYLQEPIPVGGGEFQPDKWLNYYGHDRANFKEMNVCILVDPSAGEKMNKRKGKASDWTAMMVVGLAPDQNYYLLDIIRDRLNPTERIDMLFLLHRKWLGLVNKPIRVGYEKYALMSDTHYIGLKQKNDTYNFQVIELGGTMAKDNRIRRLIPDMQNGRWYLPQNLLYTDVDGRTFDLVKELVESEMPSFPKARFDDMLDAMSRVKDPEMMMQFPAIKNAGKQNIQSINTPKEPDWRDF